MNLSSMRLARKFGISYEVADSLVAAGYDCPRKVRDASDEELCNVKGVDADDLAKLLKRGKTRE